MSSFCPVKATHIFSAKKFQHICVSLDVNFNISLTNDIVSFEQLGPGPHDPKSGVLTTWPPRCFIKVCLFSNMSRHVAACTALVCGMQCSMPVRLGH